MDKLPRRAPGCLRIVDRCRPHGLLSEVLVRATGTDAQFQMIDFRLMFVMLIGTVYGLNAGVLAAVLASVSLAAGVSAAGDNPDAAVL